MLHSKKLFVKWKNELNVAWDVSDVESIVVVTVAVETINRSVNKCK